jgi:hypothetical protein
MPHRHRWLGPVFIAIAALVVYWRTAFPSIEWWDSSEYSVAAGTFGPTGAPGSLILTLLGWPVVHLLPGDSPAHRLNLFAGVVGAATALVVYLAALRLLRMIGERDVAVSARLGAAAGALGFAFGATPWGHSVKFNPYILTALFTAAILWTMLRWWEDADRPGAWRNLAALGFLFGIDFSVHRTNATFIPAVLVWVLVRKPSVLRQLRVWIAGLASLTAGLSLQLLWIPISRTTSSPLIWNDPTDLGRLWSYVSLERVGGGFLLDVVTRKAPLVQVQLGDVARVIRANLFSMNGPAGAAGLLVGLAAVYGFVELVRRDRKLGLALLAVLATQIVVTVIYFNIPADYFRPFDRHYLPILVTCGVAVAFGAASLVRLASRSPSRMALAGAALVGLAIPVIQLGQNWGREDGSRRYFAADFARNVLQALPPNAIFFTVGDNDTFPLMYMQYLEGVREDVDVVNLSVASAVDFADQLRRHTPGFPLAMTASERKALSEKAWPDTAIVVQRDSAATPVTLRPRPPDNGTRMSVSDLTVIDILRTNAWRRPVTFSFTAGNLGWLSGYSRLDGLHRQIEPAPPLATNPNALTTMLTRNEYRGYADPAVPVGGFTRNIGYVYQGVFAELLDAEPIERCRAYAAEIESKIPHSRLMIPSGMLAKPIDRCRRR